MTLLRNPKKESEQERKTEKERERVSDKSVFTNLATHPLKVAKGSHLISYIIFMVHMQISQSFQNRKLFLAEHPASPALVVNMRFRNSLSHKMPTIPIHSASMYTISRRDHNINYSQVPCPNDLMNAEKWDRSASFKFRMFGCIVICKFVRAEPWNLSKHRSYPDGHDLWLIGFPTLTAMVADVDRLDLRQSNPMHKEIPSVRVWCFHIKFDKPTLCMSRKKEKLCHLRAHQSLSKALWLRTLNMFVFSASRSKSMEGGTAKRLG